MNKELLEIYTDFLLSSFGQVSSTGLSDLLDNAISHDRITRFLSDSDFGSRELWQLVRPTVRSVESDDGMLIFDDTIEEKPWTDENGIITWHFDHSKNRTVKGVNILNCLYHAQNFNIPVAFEIIRKPIWFCDLGDRRQKRRSEVTKNELMREMIKVCAHNNLLFKYILADCWFSSKENMSSVKLDMEKEFIMALKSNRTVASDNENRKKGHFIRVDSLELGPNSVSIVFLKGVPFPVALCKQVFINKDGSKGVPYLVSSNTSLTYDQITTIYKRRWNVETFHKSLKSNAALSKSPTRTVVTQSNHFFSSIYAFFKLELLKMKHKTNHFALRSKIYLSALKASFNELQKLAA